MHRPSPEEPGIPAWYIDAQKTAEVAAETKTKAGAGMAEWVKNNLSSLFSHFQTESREVHIPPVSTEVFLAYHGTQEDAARAEPLVKNADIVF